MWCHVSLLMRFAADAQIASLLMRFYDPAGGSVTLDGHDLRTQRSSDLVTRLIDCYVNAM